MHNKPIMAQTAMLVELLGEAHGNIALGEYDKAVDLLDTITERIIPLRQNVREEQASRKRPKLTLVNNKWTLT